MFAKLSQECTLNGYVFENDLSCILDKTRITSVETLRKHKVCVSRDDPFTQLLDYRR